MGNATDFFLIGSLMDIDTGMAQTAFIQRQKKSIRYCRFRFLLPISPPLSVKIPVIF